MNSALSLSGSTPGPKSYRETWTLGGLLCYLLAAPAFVLVMAAPVFVGGLLVGVALALVHSRLRRSDGGSSTSVGGRPAQSRVLSTVIRTHHAEHRLR